MSFDQPLSPAEHRRTWWVAAGAIAVTYFYFLIFAEFALLEVVSPFAGSHLNAVLATLGVGGLVGAVLGARIPLPEQRHLTLAWALRGCALGAGLAYLAANAPMAYASAAISGLSLGLLTVTLAASLAGATQGRHLGLCVGIGTGLAYAACNVPVLYHAAPQTQALVAAIAAFAMSLALPASLSTPGLERTGSDFNSTGVARWVAIFLALVWMDSAAFYIIQHSSSLRAVAWSSTGTLYANGLVHLVAALIAGVLIDRKQRTAIVATAATLLAIASLMLGGWLPSFVAPSLLYAAGVSLYSVALVEYPSRSGRPGTAALVYAL
ncbi:MAG TPA: hypothetical protein VGE76_03165, partial [Opitutaceae bacterium]